MASGYGLNGGMYFIFSLSIDFLAILAPGYPYIRWNGHPRLTHCFSPGPSRCYAFWQETLGCYMINAGDGEAGKKKCMPALDDYYECLHHKKEVRQS